VSNHHIFNISTLHLGNTCLYKPTNILLYLLNLKQSTVVILTRKELSMKNLLIGLFTIVFLWMIYTVVQTCFESNLFKEWNYLGSIPWMQATLWDFYANIFVLLIWVYYKETNLGSKGLWTVLFICLGSIAVTGYVLVQLFKLKPGEGLEKILLKRS
jgi:hypothetical protein